MCKGGLFSDGWRTPPPPQALRPLLTVELGQAGLSSWVKGQEWRPLSSGGPHGRAGTGSQFVRLRGGREEGLEGEFAVQECLGSGHRYSSSRTGQKDHPSSLRS